MNVETKWIDQFDDFRETSYYFQLTLGRELYSGRHNHEFYEILYFVSGSCVHEVDGTLLQLQEGSLLLLSPPRVHRSLSQADNTNLAVLSVTVEEMRKFLMPYGFDDLPGGMLSLTVRPDERPRLNRLSREGLTVDEAAFPQRMRLMLGQLLSIGLEQDDGREQMPAGFTRILAQMNTLENAAEGIDAFLRISNFSHSQLCRLTRRWLNMTPGQYVNDVRLRHAYEMIAYSELDYETICETVGFSSFSHFCKLIQKAYHMTPAKIRLQAAKQARTI
ncbi:MAG: helix-turn-helix domain-containing protein [Clostridia bacterium]|nr:helix-turn-helix domain-containing protein [Clostridia bacterium]